MYLLASLYITQMETLNAVFLTHSVILYPLHRSTPGRDSTSYHKWRLCWIPQHHRHPLLLHLLLLWVLQPRLLSPPSHLPFRFWRKETCVVWILAKTCGVLEVMRTTDGLGLPGLWLGGWLGVWLLVVEGVRTSQNCVLFALRRSLQEWGRQAAK